MASNPIPSPVSLNASTAAAPSTSSPSPPAAAAAPLSTPPPTTSSRRGSTLRPVLGLVLEEAAEEGLGARGYEAEDELW